MSKIPRIKDRKENILYMRKSGAFYWSGKRWLCLHRRERSTCRDCGGSRICPHDRIRSTCKECHGSQVCPHQRIRSWCKDCKGGSICEHERIRSQCKDCRGGKICEHQRQRQQCKDCSGSSICIHERIRYYCKECNGSGICEHRRKRSRCKDCKGSEICKHNKRRSQCLECDGIEICVHQKLKGRCGDCQGNSICRNCRQTRFSVYKPYCAGCYYHLNPDISITRNYLTKQKYLYQQLKESLPEYSFIYDQTVSDGCSRRKPDFLYDALTHSIVIENDEDCHNNHEQQCEDKRTMQLFEDLGSRPLVMLRFNPDGYWTEDGKRIKGCFSKDSKGKLQINEEEWGRRFNQLKSAIKQAIETIPKKEVTIEYFFYNQREVAEEEEEEEEMQL